MRISRFIQTVFAIALCSELFALRASAGDRLLLMTENYPPENYIVKQNGREELTGFAVDVVREIQKRVNDNSPIKTMVWGEAYEQLLKTPGAALFALGKNPTRQKELKLVGELDVNYFTLYARADKEINIVNLDDAKSYKIGVYQGDVAEQFLREQGFNNLLVAQTDDFNLDRLLGGEIDLWIVSDLKARMVADNKKIPADKFKGVFVAFTTPLYIGFNKDTDDKIVKKWQDALDKMREDGTYDKIRNDWIKKLSDGQPDQ